jgi:hypothetical protein
VRTIADLPDVAVELYGVAKAQLEANAQAKAAAKAAAKARVKVAKAAKVAQRTGGHSGNGNGKVEDGQAKAPAHDDEAILRAAGSADGFSALWHGQWTGHYPSQNEADLGLCNRLAFYCGPGRGEQVKRLFLRSELGKRDKASVRADYLDRTVAFAYGDRTEYYDWDRDDRPAFANCRAVPKEGGAEGEIELEPRSAPEIASWLGKISGEGHPWPKRVAEVLFVRGDGHRPVFLDSSTQLFGWVDGFARVYWAGGAEMITQERFFEHVRKFSAERFDAIESVPHWPPMPATYYMHPPVEPKAAGPLLDEFLGFFRPETDVDRELIRAAVLTPFWGGPPGKRPVFRIEGPADDPPELGGRGTGKSTLPVIISRLAGGYVDLEDGEEFPAFKTHLLSNEEGRKRIVRIDNVKTLRLSWAALEAFITSPVISGHALYRGEGQRPNVITVFITVNGGSLSKDMAQRVIPIRLKRPTYTPRWDDEIEDFLDAHRWGLIAEIIGTLAAERPAFATTTRWAVWEEAVLGRCGLLAECQKAIADRIEAIDADDEEAVDIEALFVKKLLGHRHNPDVQNIKIPVSDAAEWFSEYLKKPIASCTATGILRTKPLKRLVYRRTKTERFWVWMGGKANEDPVDLGAPPSRAPY